METGAVGEDKGAVESQGEGVKGSRVGRSSPGPCLQSLGCGRFLAGALRINPLRVRFPDLLPQLGV